MYEVTKLRKQGCATQSETTKFLSKNFVVNRSPSSLSTVGQEVLDQTDAMRTIFSYFAIALTNAIHNMLENSQIYFQIAEELED